ncbi:hypothetical protein FPOAC2_07789 [Fusarium poae]|nr:hypothetical protein FPOAC1_007883 [Fusarium poae]KAG8668502.1 hypothetical protein FPOAC1_007883 [Fusarium poae]
MALYDLLQDWYDARPNEQLTGALRSRFFVLMFQNWNSSIETIALPDKLGGKKLQQSAVQVGTLREDLAVTPSKSNKRDHDGRPVSRRCAGAPVWFSVQLHWEGAGIVWKWKDSSSRVVAESAVRRNDGVTLKDAISQASMKTDVSGKARIMGYNTELVVALARKRIVTFSKAGTKDLPRVSVDLKAGNR